MQTRFSFVSSFSTQTALFHEALCSPSRLGRFKNGNAVSRAFVVELRPGRGSLQGLKSFEYSGPSYSLNEAVFGFDGANLPGDSPWHFVQWRPYRVFQLDRESILLLDEAFSLKLFVEFDLYKLSVG